jgi:MoaA/NifB/PqqE/SkfB family radical SAM enzyme
LLAYCLERDVPVEMVSNGTLLGNLTDGQHDLLGRSVRLLRVSLDSADPLEHDRIRGRTGAFDKTVRFLRDPRRQVHCEILSVLTPDIERVEPMIELAAELGCRLILQPLMFESNFPGLSERVAWKVTAQRRLAAQRGVERALTRLERYARSRGVQTNLPFIRLYAPTYFRCAGTPGFFQDRLMGKFTCVIPHQRITVDESGTLLPCVLLPGKHSIRSRDRDQIYDTWLQMATKYRRMFRRGTRYRQCRSCSCHFSENFHGSLVAFPWQNRALIRWKLATVVRRSLAARLLGSSTHPGNGNGSPVRLGQDPS